MLTKTTVQFLKDLAENNTREWFTAHKNEFLSAQREFESFINALIEHIARFDSPIGDLAAKSCIFRIYRDVRFSKNKSPYKTNFGAHMNAFTKHTEIHEAAGYYIQIEPQGKSFLGGGAYMPSGEWLARIRTKIAEKPKKFLEIIESPKFTKYFTFEGEKLKRPPQGFDPAHPYIELLKHKSFLAMHTFSDKDIASKDFLKYCSDAFEALKPFDDFLNGR